MGTLGVKTIAQVVPCKPRSVKTQAGFIAEAVLGSAGLGFKVVDLGFRFLLLLSVLGGLLSAVGGMDFYTSPYMSHHRIISLKTVIEGILAGTTIGAIKADTWS